MNVLKKDNLRLETRVVLGEFLDFEYFFFVFFVINVINIYMGTFKTCYSVPNIYLNLYEHVENSKWIFCDRKIHIYFRVQDIFKTNGKKRFEYKNTF